MASGVEVDTLHAYILYFAPYPSPLAAYTARFPSEAYTGRAAAPVG